jgi:hypothetical protein
LGAEVERIAEVNALEELCLTMHELPDAAALQERLKSLLPANEAVEAVALPS